MSIDRALLVEGINLKFPEETYAWIRYVNKLAPSVLCHA